MVVYLSIELEKKREKSLRHMGVKKWYEIFSNLVCLTIMSQVETKNLDCGEGEQVEVK